MTKHENPTEPLPIPRQPIWDADGLRSATPWPEVIDGAIQLAYKREILTEEHGDEIAIVVLTLPVEVRLSPGLAPVVIESRSDHVEIHGYLASETLHLFSSKCVRIFADAVRQGAAPLADRFVSWPEPSRARIARALTRAAHLMDAETRARRDDEESGR